MFLCVRAVRYVQDKTLELETYREQKEEKAVTSLCEWNCNGHAPINMFLY